MKKLFLASALGALFSLFAFGQASIPIQVYSGPDMAGQCNPAPMAIPNPPMRYNSMDGTYWGCPNSSTPYAPVWTQYVQTSGGILASDGNGGIATTTVSSTGTGNILRATGILVACGSTAACPSTPHVTHIVIGTGTLVTGSPSTYAVTTISPAFTSASTYTCFAQDTAVIATNIGVLAAGYVSGTAVTFTGPNATTDTFTFACVGY